MVPKRTVEQVIRAEWKAATEAERAARHRLDAVKATRASVLKAFQAQEVAVLAAAERVTRALASLEAYLGEKIGVQNGESAAPATTGADAEVPDGEDVAT